MTVKRALQFAGNALIPIVAVALLVFLSFQTVATNVQLAHESRDNKVAACAAVQLSDNATLGVFSELIRGTKNDTPQAEDFLAKLAAAYATAHTKCLTG